jgi:hypothetical protein
MAYHDTATNCIIPAPAATVMPVTQPIDGATYTARARVALPPNSWAYRAEDGFFVEDVGHARSDSWAVGETAIAVDVDACVDKADNKIRHQCAQP